MLITGGRVLVGSGTYLEDGAVLVKDGLIAAVGPRKEVEEQAGADTLGSRSTGRSCRA